MASSCGDELDQRALLLLRCVCGCDVGLGDWVLEKAHRQVGGEVVFARASGAALCCELVRGRMGSRWGADETQTQMGVL